MTYQVPHKKNATLRPYRKGTEMSMFLGSDGGLLGVGAPEIVSFFCLHVIIIGEIDHS